MKRMFLLLALGLFAHVALQAQQISELRRSKTIFAYPEFKVGRVVQSFGRSVVDTVNIFLKDASLVFRRADTVYAANVDHIYGLEIDSTVYKKVGTQMARVVAQQGYNYLVCVESVDMAKYEAETTGGEGLPFFEILPETGAGFFVELDREPDEANIGLPLKHTYYFLLKGEEVPARENKVKPHVRPDMKQAFKQKMADRWWSWNDEESLKQLLIFFAQ